MNSFCPGQVRMTKHWSKHHKQTCSHLRGQIVRSYLRDEAFICTGIKSQGSLKQIGLRALLKGPTIAACRTWSLNPQPYCYFLFSYCFVFPDENCSCNRLRGSVQILSPATDSSSSSRGFLNFRKHK